MSEPVLTPTSYVVLGLVDHVGGCTSYELKAIVARSIGYFWSFPHSQLYAEPARLVELGLLAEDREEAGRRRRRYTVTEAGRAALQAWLSTPAEGVTELRDLGLLQLFFGTRAGPAKVGELARAQAEAHEARLEEYVQLSEHVTQADPFQATTLAMGLRFERAAIAFWRDVEAGADELAQGRLAAIGFPTQ
jgi:DNA-binding PadR family transcriptional regulator